MTPDPLPSLQTLVLGSASPRRRELLLQLWPALTLHVQAADIDETLLQQEGGDDRVMRLASAKADAIRRTLPAAWADDPILTADTEVVLQGEPLGKPESREHAVELLQRLSGRSHQVKTALVLCQGTTQLKALVTTEVHFRQLSETDIRAYVATGEPDDKAGGYGIQGRGAALVAGIQGSYTNVVGLPLETIAVLVQKLGYRVF